MVDHEQERLLPIANVGRIMKQVLPPNAKISKEAKQRMQDCATEFISFVTGEASDKCQKENRKTVNGDDICWALSALGLDNYADTIFRYLQKYRESEREKFIANRIGDPNKGLILLAPPNNINTSQQHQHQHQHQEDVVCHRHHRHGDVATLQFRIIEKGMSSSSTPKTE